MLPKKIGAMFPISDKWAAKAKAECSVSHPDLSLSSLRELKQKIRTSLHNRAEKAVPVRRKAQAQEQLKM